MTVSYRILDGPEAGKLFYGGLVGADFSNPLSSGSLLTERIELRHEYDPRHTATFAYALPTVYFDPRIAGKEAQPR